VGPRADNPWLGVVFDAVSAQTGVPVPPPGIPGPFSLADADKLAWLLSDAELVDVRVSELPVPLHAGSFQEWWTRTTALAGPLTKVIARRLRMRPGPFAHIYGKRSAATKHRLGWSFLA
jgi:hypothetical protein